MSDTTRAAQPYGQKVLRKPTRTRAGCKNLIRTLTVEELEN